MRWVMVLSIAAALFAAPFSGSLATAQKNQDSQGTVSLKEPVKKPNKAPDQNGVVSLKPAKQKPKPAPDPNGVVSLKQDPSKQKPKPNNTTDQNGVVSLKDEKAEEAKRREKIEKLIDSRQQGPVLLPFEKKKDDAPAAQLLPFEEKKPAPAKPETKKKKKK